MRALTPEKREVVELRYFEGLMPRAIATRLHLPVETVKTRQKRALAELRARLGGRGNDDGPVGLALAFGLRPRSVVARSATTALVTLGGVIVWKKTVLALAALLLVLIAARESLFPPDTPGDGPAPTRAADALDAGAPAPSVASFGGEGAATAAAAERDTTPEAGAPRRSSDGGTVTGRVYVLTNGEEREVKEGTLHIVDWEDGRGSDRSAEIGAGRFAFPLPAGHGVEFGGIETGGRVAEVVEPKSRLADPLERPVDVKVRIVPDTVLRVVDATTGVDLPVVFVRRALDRAASYRHPGPGLRDPGPGRPSPVRIPVAIGDVRSPRASWHVGASGYAWALASVVPRRGGEVRVPLEKAGSVSIHAAGPSLTTWVPVRLCRLAGKHRELVVALPMARDSVLTCDGLVPGRYVASAEVGEWFDKPVVLGTTTFEVVAGQRAEARLEFGAIPDPGTIHLAGELHVPAGWPLEELQMSVELVDTPLAGSGFLFRTFRVGDGLEPVEGAAGHYRFDAGEVQKGYYHVEFPKWFNTTSFRLDSSGAGPLRIEVPPPVTVRIDIEGDRGGFEPFLSTLNWEGQIPGGLKHWSYGTETRDEADAPFEFRVPAGPVSVWPGGNAYCADRFRFEALTSPTRATLRVRPTCRTRVIAMDGARQVPLESDWPCGVHPAGGDGFVRMRTVRDGALEFVVSKAGAYRMSFGPIPSFAPIPSREVTVADSECAEVRLDLVPR